MRLLLVLSLVIWQWSFYAIALECPANTEVWVGDGRFSWTLDLDGEKHDDLLFGGSSDGGLLVIAEKATLEVKIKLEPHNLIILEANVTTKLIKTVQVLDKGKVLKQTSPNVETDFPVWYTSHFDFGEKGYETEVLTIEMVSTSKEMKIKDVFVRGCVPVQWCEWGGWGKCEVSCGEGVRTRERECKCANPDLAFECDGPPTKTSICKGPCCPTPPSWGPWKKWSDCSATCGSGQKSRTRNCIPDKCPDGTDCQGNKRETDDCEGPCCPMPPSWGPWKKWSECSVTCGTGDRSRTRDCIPDECADGSECPGNRRQTEECVMDCCPVPPSWSDWKPWEKCSVTCGGGVKKRFRTCTQDPCHDGNSCPGKNEDSMPCNEDCCPEPPSWGPWKEWSKCSVSCGGGQKSRTRDCLNSGCPDNTECVGKNRETMDCNENCCEVDPIWGPWDPWQDCPVTCGGGVQERSRRCSKDDVCPSDKDCEGKSKETRACGDQCCPIAPKWKKWGKWSKCSVTCGTGVQTRGRKCKKNKQCPLVGGKCEGPKKMSQACEQPCCRERIDFNNRDGIEVTIVGGLKSRDGSKLLDGSGVTIDNILLENVDGTEKVRITFLGGSKNIIEVGMETFLSDKTKVTAKPGVWSDSQAGIDPYDGFQKSTFTPPGGQIDNQDQLTLEFGYPTGEISVAALYLIVCV